VADIEGEGGLCERQGTSDTVGDREDGRHKSAMRTTRYFLEQVLRKRPYLSVSLCEQVVRSPVRTLVQADGRRRFWGRVNLPDDAKSRILRVVTLEDGETLHNAFVDRGFAEDAE